MNIPGLKLKFHTAQLTSLNSHVIKYNVLTKLKDKKYVIDIVTENRVTFGRKPFELVWNFEAPYILTGGEFTISETKQGQLVTLNYYISTLSFLILLIGAIYFAIIQNDYFVILFFGAFLTITGTIQYFITKNVGRNLLNDILAEDISNPGANLG